MYGEVTEALHLAHMTGLARNDYASLLQLKLIRYLEKHWDEPDEGIWEVRGPRRHFVHSKVMAWVAVDRTIKLIESGDADGPLERWRELRDDIHRDVCEKGYDKERNTFTQSYGSKELDASLLLIPQMGFLPPDDKRVIGTIEAIQRELSTADGFVLRYPTAGEDAGVDGLAGDEGAFLACSFWLADDLAMIGRVDEARQALREAAVAPQRPRSARRGVGPAAPAPGGQLPAGVQPRPADRHGAAADGIGGVRRLSARRAARRRARQLQCAAGRLDRSCRPCRDYDEKVLSRPRKGATMAPHDMAERGAGRAPRGSDRRRVRPRRSGVRRRPRRLQRHDRPAARRDRPVRRRGRTSSGRSASAATWTWRSPSAAAATASRAWRSTDGGLVVDLRRMHAVTVDPGGPGGTGRRRRHHEPSRPGHPAVRPGDHRRPGVHHRRRRLHAGRRHRAGWSASSAWPATTCSASSW